jgi:DNA polymerase III subunit alpha
MTPPFIHLRVHSAYSLLEGAIGVKDVVKWCIKHRMPAVALADSGNLFASLEFAEAAAKEGIQPICGITMFFAEDGREAGNNQQRSTPDQLLLYAQNAEGLENLLHLASKAYTSPAENAAPRLNYSDLEGYTGGVMALTGGIHGALAKHLLAGRTHKADAFVERLKHWFEDRVYVEISRHGLADEKAVEPLLLKCAATHTLPVIATNDAYFVSKDQYDAHDAFLCIADGTYVSEQNRRKLTPEHRLKTPEEMAVLFADIPQALANTVHFAKRIGVMMTPRKPMLPSFEEKGQTLSEPELLKLKAEEGLEKRLQAHVYTPAMSEAEKTETANVYRERLAFEIQTIINMKFPGYFLIVSDFIRWAKQHDIPVGPGRGSGAGSLVAWSLEITDLDPLRYGLLFERFLNPERVSMPDFDVDFCQDRRDEVIAYVQKHYGYDRVAHIITFGKLQARAVLRDVGRVLQMPYGQVDKICKLVPNNPAAPVTLQQAIDAEPALQAAMNEDETVAKLIEYALQLEGLYRHASTHAAGVVIADRQLKELVPLYRDPKSDILVVQYSMKYAESAGLVKFDFLGLKTLSVLKTACALIAKKGVEIDLLKLPEGDPATYEMLGRGETMGVFQMESAGMRDTLKKLKPDCLEDLIALVSLYRPGPMDNIPTYIARKHGHEQPNYMHAKLEPVLKETFGVIIYQEQVMQIAQVLAGYSLGEADLLRRAMGKKIRAEMEAQRSIFVEKSVKNSVDKREAAGIFDLIAKFAEYGFNKSHAAAYALIAYQTAYIKANHTVEFFAATMDYDMNNTDKLGLLREEASHYGIKLQPPDINRSGVRFGVEDGHIRYALAAVRNVGAQAMEQVVAEREKNGSYKDVFDLIARVPPTVLSKRNLEFLIKAGAFDTLHESRAQLMEHLDTILAYGATIAEEKTSNQVSLFASVGEATRVPQMKPVADWTSLEKLAVEFEAIGFYLSAHPIETYRAGLQRKGVLAYAELAEKLEDKYKPVRLCGIVTGRKFKASERGRFAFVQMSDETGVFEVSVFDEKLLTQMREKLEPGTLLLIEADGKQEEAGIRLIVRNMFDLEEAMAKAPSASLLKISLSHAEAMARIKPLLADGNGKGLAIEITAELAANEHATVRLPGRYALSPQILEKIKLTQGVKAVEEV